MRTTAAAGGVVALVVFALACNSGRDGDSAATPTTEATSTTLPVTTTSTTSSTTSTTTITTSTTEPVARLRREPRLVFSYPASPEVRVSSSLAQGLTTVDVITPTETGWLAGGSVSPPAGFGLASVWRVDTTGAFAEPTLLPAIDTDTPAIAGTPSVVRDLVVTGDLSVAVGLTGSGLDGRATAWVSHGSDEWTATRLPAQDKGSIADRVLALDDGTLVVVGRAFGTFFSSLHVWASFDDGETWKLDESGSLRTREPPVVATDGVRVAMLTRDSLGDDSQPAYFTAVFTRSGAEFPIGSVGRLFPNPAQWFRVTDLAWDGRGFVAQIETLALPMLAESSDGLTYVVSEPELPGLASGGPTITGGGVAIVGGEVYLAFNVDDVLTVVRRAGDRWESVAAPPVPPTAPSFLSANEPMASNGDQLTMLVRRADTRQLLQLAGGQWTVRDVAELLPEIRAQRYDMRNVESTGGADLAMLAYAERAEEDGVFVWSSNSLLWRPALEDEWQLLDYGDDFDPADAIGVWNDQFVIGSWQRSDGFSTIQLLDPEYASVTAIGELPGWVSTIVGAADGLYALTIPSIVEDRGQLYYSPDGADWTVVDTSPTAVDVCSDGTSAVAAWSRADGNAETFGFDALDHGEATLIGEPWTSRDFEIVTARRGQVPCATKGDEMLGAHLSWNDDALPDVLIHLQRFPSWDVSPEGSADSLTRVLSTETDARDIAWDGDEWIAVGDSKDPQGSLDAMLFRSDDGSTWEYGEVIAGGPGLQLARSITITDDTVLISGISNEDAVIWELPLCEIDQRCVPEVEYPGE